MMSAQRGAVVVGVDGSADSDRAVAWAAATAAAHHAPLHLLYALSQTSYDIPFPNPADTEFAEQLLAEARARVGTDVTVNAEVVDAPPVPALRAAGEHALMIVVGARGHGAVTGLLLGSVSQHVSRHAPCPVVVIREQADPKARRIVVGVDGSASSQKAVGFALDTASRTNAPLVAMHGWHDVTRGGVGSTWPAMAKVAEHVDEVDRLIAEAMAGWAEKYPDVTVTREAIPVHPARMLADASQHAALLVAGSRGRGEFAGLLLGSISQAVLNHGQCPVAVIR